MTDDKGSVSACGRRGVWAKGRVGEGGVSAEGACRRRGRTCSEARSAGKILA